MQFTKEELNSLRSTGKSVCVHSNFLLNVLRDFSLEDFGSFSSRLHYYWKNGSRPIPIEVVLRLMDEDKIDKLELESFSLSGGNRVIFPSENELGLYYFLGLILGDGCLVHTKKSGNRNTFRVQITFRTKLEANNACALAQNLFDVKSSIYPGKGCYNLCLYSKPIVLLLHKRYEIPIGLKYKYLKVPEKLFSRNRKETIAFLKGVFDSDGNIYNHKNKKSVQLRQKSYKFLSQLRDLFVKVGINFNEPYYDKANNSWVLWSSKKELVDNFINEVDNFNIIAPVAQPG